MAILLIGFMASGKTSYGRCLAKKLDKEFYDLDELISQKIQMSIDQYFSLYGQASFRRVEEELLETYIKEDIVLATGGGVVESEINQKLIQQNRNNIYLQSDFLSLYKRMEIDNENIRPLFKNNSYKELEKIYQRRLPIYEDLATEIISN